MYGTLIQQLGKKPDRRGWVAADCPNCGERRRRKAAFNQGGFNCFVCGHKCSLAEFASGIGVESKRNGKETVIAIRKPRPRYWHKEPQVWLDRALEDLRRVELWQRYRPFTLDSIQKYRLGIGIVPATPCPHKRLVYPYNDSGRVTLRGRIIDCGCDPKSMKWLTAGGGSAALWGIEYLMPGCRLVVCESPVDAMLLMQEDESVVAVAGTAGASTWRREWTQVIADARPSIVVVAYDNDLQGQATGETREQLAREWLEKRPKLPVANGPRVANFLLDAGLDAVLYDWKDAPPKADVGWKLTTK